MKWEKNKPLDVIVGTAAKTAEDMVHGTGALIKDMATYCSMYRNMAAAQRKTISNLKKHAMAKGMNNKDTRIKVAYRILQIETVARTCDGLAQDCTNMVGELIKEMHKFENIKLVRDIVGKIELPKDEGKEEKD